MAPTETPNAAETVAAVTTAPESGVGSTFSKGSPVSIFLLLVLAAFAGATGWQIRPRERRR